MSMDNLESLLGTLRPRNMPPDNALPSRPEASWRDRSLSPMDFDVVDTVADIMILDDDDNDFNLAPVSSRGTAPRPKPVDIDALLRSTAALTPSRNRPSDNTGPPTPSPARPPAKPVDRSLPSRFPPPPRSAPPPAAPRRTVAPPREEPLRRVYQSGMLPDELKGPLETGLSAFPYQCPECPTIATSLVKVLHHMQQHRYPIHSRLAGGSQQKTFGCLQCGKAFEVWGDCLAHLEETGHYPHPVKGVLRHELSKIDNQPTVPEAKGDGGPFKNLKYRCPQCGQLFTRWNLCLQHLAKEQHHPFEEKDKETQCLIKNQKAPYRCPECGRLNAHWTTCLNHLTSQGHFPHRLKDAAVKEKICLVVNQNE
jgi:predicted RNA-binding Zn-ribbon protein involved in translation (DUF1610 family)